MVKAVLRPFIAFLPLFLLLILILNNVAAQEGELPLIPHSFYGTVKINDQNAPAGTKIYVFINGVLRGSIETTESGFYGRFPKLAIDGTSADRNKLIVFCIGALKANQTSRWQSAKVERLNLTTSAENCPYNLEATPQPSPTPTPTSTRTPAPTRTPNDDGAGGGGGSSGGSSASASPTQTQSAKTPQVAEKILLEETIHCKKRDDLEGFLVFVKKEQRKKSAMALDGLLRIERKIVLKEMSQGNKKWLRAEVMLIIENVSGRRIENLFLIEEIPKEIAESADSVKSKRNFAVLIKDPVIEFYLGSIENAAVISVQYYSDIDYSTDINELKAVLTATKGPVAYEVKESKDCNDNNPCTIDEFKEEIGSCQYTVLPDGTKCGTGKECKAGKCTEVKETKAPVETEMPLETTAAKEKVVLQDYLWVIFAVLAAFFVVGISILIRRYNIVKEK
ncbi:MAG: hypothetical protein N3F05_04355 [Candidatus Diapherotrites archaeon]|nr:hypothetical protein [Candidatus Diapherotrites archaeon]